MAMTTPYHAGNAALRLLWSLAGHCWEFFFAPGDHDWQELHSTLVRDFGLNVQLHYLNPSHGNAT